MRYSHALFLSLLLAGSLCALPAQAEKTDRDQPVNLEADRITVDDAKKLHILEGNVRLSQGTLAIRCEKLVVTQDAQGFQKGLATGGSGGLARFRQKRDGKDEYVDGEAERIVHDSKTGKTEFFQRAYAKSGSDEEQTVQALYPRPKKTGRKAKNAESTIQQWSSPPHQETTRLRTH